MPSRFLNNITVNDEYTLPSADGAADQIITTDGAGQLSFVDQNTINAGNAEHVVIYAKNTHTASIAKGTPVYITGTVGATDTVEIAPADAGNSAKMPAVGLLDATLAVNAFGYVITGGFMDNITTDPIDGVTPTSNDTVYVKVGGGLTLTKPTGPTGLIQNVAKVGKVSGGSAGSLIVSSILRTNDVPNLTTGKIWVGDGNTVESTVVHLDEVNERMGIGTTSPIGAVHIIGPNTDPAMTTSALVIEQSDGAKILIDGNDIDAAAGMLYLNDYSTNDVVFGGQIRVGGGGSPVGNSWFANGNVGIGTTSPTHKLQIDGSTGIRNSMTSQPAYGYANVGAGDFVVGGNSIYPGVITLYNQDTTISAGQDLGVIQFVGKDDSSTGYTSSMIKGTTANAAGTGNSGGGILSFLTTSGYGNPSERMRINHIGNVGIGTTSPNEKLEVNGSVRVTGAGLDVGYGNNSNNFVQIGNGRTTNGFAFIDLIGDTTYSDYGFRISRNNGGANTNTDLIHRGTGFLNLNATQAGGITLKTSNVERVRVNSSGNVGIATTSPRTKLHVSGLTGDDDPALGSSTAPFFVSNTATSYGLNIGVNNVGASWLQAQSNTSATAYEMSLNPLGGNVGVGFINPSYKLDVNGTGRFTNTLYYSSLVQQSQADTKKDIANIDKNKATAIPFKQYKYKTGDTERVRYGVIVEDIEQHYPELVHTGEDGIKGVSYIDLLVKRVAELEKELEDISLTPGAQGPQGPQGPAGSNGKDGSVGATGPQGPQGATGATGPQGAAGANGTNGTNGNDHLKNVQSINFNEKSGQLEITIEGYKDPFRFNPAK